MGAVLDLPANHHCQFSNFTHIGLNWLVNTKRPPGFESNFNGTTFQYHFYVKTIGHLVPAFFMHNILYTIGVPPSKISQIKENKGTLLY